MAYMRLDDGETIVLFRAELISKHSMIQFHRAREASPRPALFGIHFHNIGRRVVHGGSAMSKRGIFMVFLVMWFAVTRVNRIKQANLDTNKGVQVSPLRTQSITESETPKKPSLYAWTFYRRTI